MSMTRTMTKLSLTSENYYSPEANEAYFSVSQFKDFLKCPAMAMAKLRGEYAPEQGRALLLGSYLDEMLTGTNESVKQFLVAHSFSAFPSCLSLINMPLNSPALPRTPLHTPTILHSYTAPLEICIS